MRVKEIRKKARECLKGKWAKTSVFLYLFSLLSSLAMSGYYILCIASELIENDKLFYLSLAFLIPGIIVQAILQVGVLRAILNIAKGKDYKFSDMFSGARYWLKALGIILLISLFTLLWTLLFIIPGIIKAYSYSMSLFVLAENPEKGVLECITESRKIMKGNKWKYFCLAFTISLWGILYSAIVCLVVFGLTIVLPQVFKSFGAAMLIIFLFMSVLIMIYAIVTYIIMSYLYVAQGVMYLEISKEKVEDTSEEEIIEESTAKDSENDEELSDTSFETEENAIISSDTDLDN